MYNLREFVHNILLDRCSGSSIKGKLIFSLSVLIFIFFPRYDWWNNTVWRITWCTICFQSILMSWNSDLESNFIRNIYRRVFHFVDLKSKESLVNWMLRIVLELGCERIYVLNLFNLKEYSAFNSFCDRHNNITSFLTFYYSTLDLVYRNFCRHNHQFVCLPKHLLNDIQWQTPIHDLLADHECKF